MRRPTSIVCSISIVCLIFILGLDSTALADPRTEYGDIELLRDRWGIPHVFSSTDAGALYGLGRATAEDRGFQMYYSLRIIQGRLAEVLGDVKKTRRRETAVQNDRKMRTFGFYRAAKMAAAQLDAESLGLLRAYCEGVNDTFANQREKRHHLFDRLGLEPEPWTPADCIASWWHLAQFFATDGTRDLISYRNASGGEATRRVQRGAGGRGASGRGARGGRGAPPRPRPDLKPLGPDDSTAVVRKEAVSEEWIRDVRGFAKEHGLDSEPGRDGTGPRFSHAWVVGGRRSTTGSAVLVSDPQTPVANPSLFYEFHIAGKTLDVRGIGVPGSPIILIGFNRKVAWGMTALGADQADLFRLKTDPSRPDEYSVDGKWHRMEVRTETIVVKGSDPRRLTIRETHFGPVATEFCFARPDEPPVAIRRVPICEPGRETATSAIAMMRAKNSREFLSALAGWRFPTANVVFGDADGSVGYSVVGAIPVRSRRAIQNGRQAHDGSTAALDWQGYVPARLVPRLLDPPEGSILSANHRPVGSFYPIPLGGMTGMGGETVRSWRLRELLSETAKRKLTPDDVLKMHQDTVNPARRAIVTLGLHLRDGLERDLSPDALAALKNLQEWHRRGASADLSAPGAALASGIDTFFRFVTTDLTQKYGGGQSGLAYFLKDATARIRKNPRAGMDDLELEFVDNALARAWRQTREQYGRDPALWNERAREAVRQRRLGYYESLDGFGSLDTEQDLPVPALSCVDGNTILSQAAQAYTQWVPLHDPDSARTILPIGNSERPESIHRTSTYEDWAQGKLHPAPLSRPAVERITVSRQRFR